MYDEQMSGPDVFYEIQNLRYYQYSQIYPISHQSCNRITVIFKLCEVYTCENEAVDAKHRELTLLTLSCDFQSLR